MKAKSTLMSVIALMFVIVFAQTAAAYTITPTGTVGLTVAMGISNGKRRRIHPAAGDGLQWLLTITVQTQKIFPRAARFKVFVWKPANTCTGIPRIALV